MSIQLKKKAKVTEKNIKRPFEFNYFHRRCRDLNKTSMMKILKFLNRVSYKIATCYFINSYCLFGKNEQHAITVRTFDVYLYN